MNTINNTIAAYASGYTSAVARGETRTNAIVNALRVERAFIANEIKRTIERATKIHTIEIGGGVENGFYLEYTA